MKLRTPPEWMLSTLNASSQLRIDLDDDHPREDVSRQSAISTSAMSMCERLAAAAAERCNQGANLSGSATARISAKSPAGSVHSAIGVQPPASSSTRPPRGPYLWLFSVWIDEPAVEVEAAAGDREVDVARGDQVHFDARQDVVPARFMAEGVDRDVAVELAVDALEQVEVELGGDALGIVIGGDQPLDRLDPVHADQELGAGAEQARKWRSRSVALHGTKLPIVEPGKKPSLGRSRDLGREAERPGEIGDDGKDVERREALLKLGRAGVQIVARNVDGT